MGKTQVEFERGYYVMDVLDVLDAADRSQAQSALLALNTAVMAQTTDAEAFKRYANELHRKAGVGTTDKQTFDEAGFKMLQLRLSSGK